MTYSPALQHRQRLGKVLEEHGLAHGLGKPSFADLGAWCHSFEFASPCPQPAGAAVVDPAARAAQDLAGHLRFASEARGRAMRLRHAPALLAAALRESLAVARAQGFEEWLAWFDALDFAGFTLAPAIERHVVSVSVPASVRRSIRWFLGARSGEELADRLRHVMHEFLVPPTLDPDLVPGTSFAEIVDRLEAVALPCVLSAAHEIAEELARAVDLEIAIDRAETEARLRAYGPLRPVFTEGLWRRYQEGTWEPVDADVVRREVTTVVNGFKHLTYDKRNEAWEEVALCPSATLVNDVYEDFKARTSDPSFFRRTKSDSVSITFRNGQLLIIDGHAAWVGLSAGWRSPHAYPFDLDAEIVAYLNGGPFPAAISTPGYDAHLARCFAGHVEPERTIQTIEAHVGLGLLGIATRCEKALYFTSFAGGTGKTTTAQIYAGLFPPGAVASVSTQELGDPNSLLRLVGAAYNVRTENPIDFLEVTDALKAVITGEVVEVKRLYENRITFAPIAGHLFAGNGLPEVRDRSGGFYRRFIPIVFRNVVPDGARDKQFAEHLLERERFGILLRCLRAALEAWRVDRCQLALPPDSAEPVEEWKSQDPVLRFYRERLLDDPAGTLTAEELYGEYLRMVTDENQRPLSKQKFLVTLAGHGVRKDKVHGGRMVYRVKRGAAWSCIAGAFKPPVARVAPASLAN